MCTPGGGGGGDGGGGGGGGSGGDAGEAAVGTPTELKWQYADGDGIDFDDPSDVTILKKTAYTNLISGLPYVLLRCSDVNVDWNMCVLCAAFNVHRFDESFTHPLLFGVHLRGLKRCKE